MFGFFSSLKCCAKQQYPTITEKKVKKNTDYLHKRTYRQPKVFFGFHFLCFLDQNYSEVHKMSISSVLWLGFGLFSVFPMISSDIFL